MVPPSKFYSSGHTDVVLRRSPARITSQSPCCRADGTLPRPWYVSAVSTFPNTFALILDSNLHDLNGTNPDWRCFQQNCHGVIYVLKQKFSEWPETPRNLYLENIKNTGRRIHVRGPPPVHEGGGAPAPLGTPPCLVGPLLLHRPQLQLHIFVFREKKTKEKDSSRFTIRSRRQSLKPLGRADLESVRGSGEGNPSPSSSSTILHHQFHDAHRRAWVIPS